MKAPPQGYTAKPIRLDCFNCMINRVGRGVARDFDVGQYCTVVCTFPYQGPAEEQLIAMEEEAYRRAEDEAEDRYADEVEAQREQRRKEKAERKAAEEKAEQDRIDRQNAEMEGKLEDVRETMQEKPIYAR